MRHAQQWIACIALACVVLWPTSTRASDDLKDLEVTLEVLNNETDDLDASMARVRSAETSSESASISENDGFVDDADNSDADAELGRPDNEARDIGFERDPEFNDDNRLRGDVPLDQEEEVELDLIDVEEPGVDMN